jgi:hypothetical protein
MRGSLTAAFIALVCTALFAQAPAPVATAPAATSAAVAAPATTPAAVRASAAAPAAPPKVQNSDLGFSYGLPSDWEFVALPPPLPTGPYPDLPPPAKKGNGCVEVALTARRGTPTSVVVVMTLPFDCYGQAMAASDLAGFGTGAEEGLKESFDIVDPVYGNYPLGSHNVWIERAKGTPKGQPQSPYTFEIACTLLKKGAVCWMTMAADDASLKAFEQQAVTLEGDAFDALVPATFIDLAPATKPNKPS